jgi:hypothetical protein
VCQLRVRADGAAEKVPGVPPLGAGRGGELVIEIREAQDAHDFGPAPVVVIRAQLPPVDGPHGAGVAGDLGELVISRQQAVELTDRLAELVERWR